MLHPGAMYAEGSVVDYVWSEGASQVCPRDFQPGFGESALNSICAVENGRSDG